MNVAPELVVAPLASALLVGGAAWIAVQVEISKLRVQGEERERARLERDLAVEKKIDRIESIVGIANANGSAFMRRGECLALESNVAVKLAEIKTELHDFRVEVDGRISKLEDA